MKEFLDLLHSLYEDELYDSTLLLSETLYIQTNTIDFMYFIIKSLHKLSNLHRVIDILNQNKGLLENYDIKKIYLKAISETKLPSISIPHNSTHIHKFSSFPINEESILLYHKAKVENDIIKFKLLVKSFEIDERNLQALFVIKLYSLCDNTQFNKLIDSMQNKILSTVYKQCFFQNISPVDLSIKDDYNTFSPFTFLNHARSFYKSKDQNKLFSLAVFMSNKYPNCFISSVVLGLYYLLRKQYPEAKKCFYDSITKNNEFGLSWLYFGISLSHLKEGMNTLSSFRNAKKYMIGSYKPKFYLAREFSLLNVPESALCYYKEIVSNNKIVNFYYAIFLLHEEMPNDLKIVLSRLKNIELDENEKCVLNLLIFFEYLGATKLVEAERILDNGITDWRYYLCKGYCYHIKGDLVKALEYYHEAEVHCESKMALLEDLMKFSMLDKREGYGIDIVDYLIDVFDSLNLYSLFELPI